LTCPRALWHKHQTVLKASQAIAKIFNCLSTSCSGPSFFETCSSVKIANKDNSVHIGVGHSVEVSNVHGIVIVRCSGLFLVCRNLFGHKYFYVPKNLGVIPVPGEPKRLLVQQFWRCRENKMTKSETKRRKSTVVEPGRFIARHNDTPITCVGRAMESARAVVRGSFATLLFLFLFGVKTMKGKR